MNTRFCSFWIVILLCISFQGIAFAGPLSNSEMILDVADYYCEVLDNARGKTTTKTLHSFERVSVVGPRLAPDLEEIYTFRDLRGDVTAYVVSTVNSIGEVGCITIGAGEDIAPLCASSSAFHPMKHFDECLERACEINPAICDNPDNFLPVYVGMFFYFFVFDLQSDGPVVVEARSRSVVPYDVVENMQLGFEKARKKLGTSWPKEWERLLSGNRAANSVMSKNINNLPVYNWYRGCTTTTSTIMLSHYGRNKGFSGLDEAPDNFQWTRPDGWFLFWYFGCEDFPSDITIPQDLADDLADEMGISQDCGLFANFGANAGELAGALEAVALDRGYAFDANVLPETSINEYISEIDMERPVEIGYNVAVYGDPDWNAGHSVAGWGYTTHSATNHSLWFNTTWDNYPNDNSFNYEQALAAGHMMNFITLLPPPDLTISSSDISMNPSGPVNPGTQVNITATIHNDGGKDATCDVLIFYDDQAAGVCVTIDNFTDVSVEGGGTEDVQTTWDTTGLRLPFTLYMW